MRRSVRGFFDRLTSGWDERVRPDAPENLAALAAAVARLEAPPGRALDLGTGTGAGALWLAREFPEARATGMNLRGDDRAGAGEASRRVVGAASTSWSARRAAAVYGRRV